MTNVEIVTVSEHGQIVLPKQVRKQLHIKKGQKLLLIEKENQITLSKVEKLLKKQELPEAIGAMLASQKTLEKDWKYKGDDVWDEY